MTSDQIGPRPRVLLLSHYFEPENGAPQRRWRALIDRLVTDGFSIDVIAPAPHHPTGRSRPSDPGDVRAGSSTVRAYGARVHRVSFVPHNGRIVRRAIDHVWVAAMTMRRAGLLIRRGLIRPQVVVATVPALPTLIAGVWISRRYRIPLVVEMRDAWPDLLAHTPGLRKGRSFKTLMKRCIHNSVTNVQRGADLVVTTTVGFGQVLASRGITNVQVIRNGTVPEAYEAIGSATDDHEELRVLYMGTLGRSQGLDVVVQAAAHLRDNGAPVAVRIVGTGADATVLRQLNERLGWPADILAEVTPANVFEHYSWADTCVVSLRDWTPFEWTVPSKLYELMATGRHVTAILRGEGARIVQDSGAGVVVPPGDVKALTDTWRELAQSRAGLWVGNGGQVWVRDNVDFRRLGDLYAHALRRLITGVGD